jgi:hypothetical protein
MPDLYKVVNPTLRLFGLIVEHERSPEMIRHRSSIGHDLYLCRTGSGRRYWIRRENLSLQLT